MRQALVVVIALSAGFIGGFAGSFTFRTREVKVSKVLRAQTFELVNEAGQAISFWGVDKGKDIVLAFGSGLVIPPAGEKIPAAARPTSLEDPANQRVAIGIIDEYPFVTFRSADTKTRMRQYLNEFGKPFLLMEDETGPRLSLGVEQSDTPGPGDNDWSLAFYPERARIGMITENIGGKTYVRGGLSVHNNRVRYPPDPSN